MGLNLSHELSRLGWSHWPPQPTNQIYIPRSARAGEPNLHSPHPSAFILPNHRYPLQSPPPPIIPWPPPTPPSTYLLYFALESSFSSLPLISISSPFTIFYKETSFLVQEPISAIPQILSPTHNPEQKFSLIEIGEVVYSFFTRSSLVTLNFLTLIFFLN